MSRFFNMYIGCASKALDNGQKRGAGKFGCFVYRGIQNVGDCWVSHFSVPLATVDNMWRLMTRIAITVTLGSI
jgi:hypothetical protein